MTENRVAVVTGAAQGIGHAIAESLAGQGIAVAIADLDGNKAGLAARAIGDTDNTGASVIGVPMNVADPDSVRSGVDMVIAELGKPTILVNNAGIYRGGPALEVSLDDWRLLLDVMLTGPLLLVQALAPFMIEAQAGRIVNLGSLSSHTAFGEDLAYCVAKTGIIGFTRSLAAEFAKHNICVNAVCPGNILTDMLREGGRSFEKRDGLEADSWLRERHKSIPLGRLGEPRDVANLVRFLCSSEADYITGQAMTVNGGLYYL